MGKWGEMWVHFRKLRDGYTLHFIFLYLLTELGGKESKTVFPSVLLKANIKFIGFCEV